MVSLTQKRPSANQKLSPESSRVRSSNDWYYTYQVGEGVGDVIATPVHSESIIADSLGEAIDKAKAITKLRPAHAKETVVRIVQDAADEYPLWAASAAAVRNA